MKILNVTRQTVLANNAAVADTFWSRMKGLLGRAGLGPDEALVITRCQSIHMFFMRFPIDVVFLDRQGAVVGIVANIRPFELSPIFWKANRAVELPVGAVANSRTIIGDYIADQP